MNPQEGFTYSNWSSGYGDLHLKIDLDSLRVLSWLDKTALVLCDVDDEDHNLVDEAPRSMLKKQIKKMKNEGMIVKAVSG